MCWIAICIAMCNMSEKSYTTRRRNCVQQLNNIIHSCMCAQFYNDYHIIMSWPLGMNFIDLAMTLLSLKVSSQIFPSPESIPRDGFL